MCSFVVNRFSNSAALEWNHSRYHIITNRQWRWLFSWDIWTWATFLPALLRSQCKWHQGCLFLFEIHHQLPVSTKPSDLSMGQFVSLCSSSPPVSTHPALFTWAVTRSKATVDYFWGVSVPNSDEISQHINTPYASHNVPSSSGIQFLVIYVSA